MKAIGVDVGGTFTDIVYCDMETGHVAIFTKPLELGELPGGSARALRDLALPRADRRLIIHNQLAVSI